jgi:hypothetical protein
MTKRGRGRPRKTERDHMGDLLWLEEMMAREADAMLRDGLKPAKTLVQAALKLGMSERKGWSLKAEINQPPIDWSKTPLGDWLRQHLADEEAKKNSGTELFAVDSCSAD